MEKLISKLNQILESRLPGCQFSPETSRTRVGGTILWDGFSGKDQVERQEIVRNLIREQFNRDQQLRISLIVTLTPQEYLIIKQESA